MKTLLYSIVALSLSFSSNGKETKLEQSAHVSVKASGIDRINIDANNTETSIEIWNKDEISIDAHFYYRGEEDHEKIREFMATFEENVKAGVISSGSAVSIDTYRAVPSKKKLGWANFSIVDLAFSEDEAKLVYTIKVPASVFMDIKHSYKDLYIKGDIDDIHIEQYSGTLKLGRVKKAKLNLKYGDARILALKEADIYLYEQKVNGKNWGDIKLNAKYSQLRVDNIKNLSGDGYETKYHIINLKNLSGNYKYSRFDVRQIKQAELICFESNLESKNIKNLKLINSKYSNYRSDTLGTLNITESFEDDYSLQSIDNIYAGSSKYGNFSIGTLKGDFTLNGFQSKVKVLLVAGQSGKIDITGKYLNVSLGLKGRNYKFESNLQYGNINYPDALTGKFTQKGTSTIASLNTPNIGSVFYTVKVTGFEVQVELR
jgi:hypothetical protein